MYLAITLILTSVILFYCSYSISAGVYLKSLCHNREKDGVIAITFDDGVDPNITPKVLDTLKRYNAKATFFIIGSKAVQYPELVKRIVEEGHNIGNHSYYHRGVFPSQSNKLIFEEIEKCSKVLESITKERVRFFRPPFGVTNPNVASPVKRLGLISIGWSIRSLDTVKQPREVVAKRVNNKINKRLKKDINNRVISGEVVLLHDNREGAQVLLTLILENIKEKGLKAVTVSELFDI